MPDFEISLVAAIDAMYAGEPDVAVAEAAAAVASAPDRLWRERARVIDGMARMMRAGYRENHELAVKAARDGHEAANRFLELERQLPHEERLLTKLRLAVEAERALLDWRALFSSLQVTGRGEAEDRLRRAARQKRRVYIKALNACANLELDLNTRWRDKPPILRRLSEALGVPALALLLSGHVQRNPSLARSPNALKEVYSTEMAWVLGTDDPNWERELWGEVFKTREDVLQFHASLDKARRDWLDNPYSPPLRDWLLACRENGLANEVEDEARNAVQELMLKWMPAGVRKWVLFESATGPEDGALALAELIKWLFEGPYRDMMWLFLRLERPDLSARPPLLGRIGQTVKDSWSGTPMDGLFRSAGHAIRNMVGHEDLEPHEGGIRSLARNGGTPDVLTTEEMKALLEDVMMVIAAMLGTFTLTPPRKEGAS